MLRKLLIALSSFWLIAIIFYYYIEIPHYIGLIPHAPTYALKSIVIIGALIIWYTVKTWGGKKLKISIIGTLLTLSIVFVAHAQLLNMIDTPSRYIGPTVIKSGQGNTVRFVKPGEKVNPKLIVLRKNQLITDKKAMESLSAGMTQGQIFSSVPAHTAMINLLKNLAIAIGPILLTWLIAYIIGFHLQLRFINRKKPEEAHPILAIAIGYVIIFTISFILAVLGIFTVLSAWITAAILIAISIPSLPKVYKNLTRSHEINFKLYSIWGLILLIALMSFFQYIIGTFHNVPVGIDGARLYIKVVYDMIRMGTLPAGYPPFSGEIIYGFASLLTTQTVQAVMFIPIAHIFLAMAAMYRLATTHFNAKKSVILTVMLYMSFMSMTLFLAVLDHKTEYFSLFFGILSVHALISWVKGKKLSDLIQTAFFAGFALASKMTFIILVLAVFCIVSFQVFKKWGAATALAISILVIIVGGKLQVPGIDMTAAMTSNLRYAMLAIVLVTIIGTAITHRKTLISGLKKLIIFGIIVAIPLMPWFAVHYAEAGSFSVNALLFGQKKSLDTEALTEGYQCTINEGFALDYGRYFNYDRKGFGELMLEYLQLPWDMTMNTMNPNSNTTDIGFLMVAFLPFLVVLNWKRRKSTALKYLAATTAFMWFFWMLVSPGVTWYGICALATTLIMIAVLWPDNQKQKILSAILLVITTIALFLMSNYHTLRIERVFIATGIGLIDQDEFYRKSFPNYPEIIGLLSDEDRIIKRGEYVLKAGGSMEYFMKRGYEIVFSDNYFDFFKCGVKKHGGDADAFIEVMKERGFKYVFLSKALFREPRAEMRNRYVNAYNSLKPHMKSYVDNDKIFFGKFK